MTILKILLSDLVNLIFLMNEKNTLINKLYVLLRNRFNFWLTQLLNIDVNLKPGEEILMLLIFKCNYDNLNNDTVYYLSKISFYSIY